jgi:hypothetical protein
MTFRTTPDALSIFWGGAGKSSDRRAGRGQYTEVPPSDARSPLVHSASSGGFGARLRRAREDAAQEIES